MQRMQPGDGRCIRTSGSSGRAGVGRSRETAAWVQLVVVGLFEVAWAVGITYTQGFTHPVASVLTVAGMIASFWFLSRALRKMPSALVTPSGPAPVLSARPSWA